METWHIALGWVLFAGLHIGMAAEPVRSTLVDKLGAGPFRGLFSLAALATFGFLVYAYWAGYPAGSVWLGWGAGSFVTVRIAEVLGVAAFILLFAGFFNRTPMGMIPGNPEPFGITRITRHPMNMAFAVFAIGHLLTNRHAGDWIFFGGFVLYGVLGSWHQDRKVARRSGESMGAFIAATSMVPFAAILAGRQKLMLREISIAGVVLGLAVAVAARFAHP